MAIKSKCQECGHVASFPDIAARKKGRCRNCGYVFVVTEALSTARQSCGEDRIHRTAPAPSESSNEAKQFAGKHANPVRQKTGEAATPGINDTDVRASTDIPGRGKRVDQRMESERTMWSAVVGRYSWMVRIGCQLRRFGELSLNELRAAAKYYFAERQALKERLISMVMPAVFRAKFDRDILIPESDFCTEHRSIDLSEACIVCGAPSIGEQRDARTLVDVRWPSWMIIVVLLFASFAFWNWSWWSVAWLDGNQIATYQDQEELRHLRGPTPFRPRRRWFPKHTVLSIVPQAKYTALRCVSALPYIGSSRLMVNGLEWAWSQGRWVLPVGCMTALLWFGYRKRSSATVDVCFKLCSDHEHNTRYPEMFLVRNAVLVRVGRAAAKEPWMRERQGVTGEHEVLRRPPDTDSLELTGADEASGDMSDRMLTFNVSVIKSFLSPRQPATLQLSLDKLTLTGPDLRQPIEILRHGELKEIRHRSSVTENNNHNMSVWIHGQRVQLEPRSAAALSDWLPFKRPMEAKQFWENMTGIILILQLIAVPIAFSNGYLAFGALIWGSLFARCRYDRLQFDALETRYNEGDPFLERLGSLDRTDSSNTRRSDAESMPQRELKFERRESE